VGGKKGDALVNSTLFREHQRSSFRIPDGVREQALHAIGARFSGVFGQVPTIFARRVTHDADAG
jgi:hypothetical protein